MCVYICACVSVCGLVEICGIVNILFFSLINWAPAVECWADTRGRRRWGVFERPKDLLECLISSVAVNMLPATFLHLSCLCRGHIHFVFVVIASHCRLDSFLSISLLSSFCCLLSLHQQRKRLVPLSQHLVSSPRSIYCTYLEHCTSTLVVSRFSIRINTNWAKFHVFSPMVVEQSFQFLRRVIVKPITLQQYSWSVANDKPIFDLCLEVCRGSMERINMWCGCYGQRSPWTIELPESLRALWHGLWSW